jgi:AcrR family transcriptional regulator
MADGTTTICEGTLSLRERHRQAQEEAILAAAHTLIVEKGFEATTMDDIAARANISKPTLYARFPSKEAIVVRTIVALQQEGLAFMRTLPADLTPAERLRTILHYLFTRKLVIKRGTFGAQRVALIPQIRSHPEYQKHAAEIITMLVAIITEGQQEGSFLPELSARLAAQTMFSFMRDTEIDELIASGVVTAENTFKTLTEIILRGIETR